MTFRRRTDSITGPAKFIDGDTIVVAEQLVRLTASTPRTGPDVLVAGPACGTMSLAALEALIAVIKVRCEVVEWDGIVAKVFSPNGVDISRRSVSAGWALAYRRYSTARARRGGRGAGCGGASNRRKLIRPDTFTLALARAGRYAVLLQHPFDP